MNKIRSILTLLLLLLMFISGCNDPLNPRGQFPISIKTDKNHYNLNQDDFVTVTITNKSSETIFYSTCFEKTIEAIKDDELIETFGTPVCYCICTAVLKPGESIPENISSLSIETIKSRVENLATDESVSYRIQYSLYYDGAFGDEPVPVKYSRTNKFAFIIK